MARTYLSRLGTHLLLWLSIALPLLITGPLQMFSANFGDFDIGAKQLALLDLPFLALPICGALVTAALPLQTAVVTLLAWLAIGIYVQGNIAVWDYGRFDGTDIPWAEFASRGYADVAIWLGLLAIIVTLRHKLIKELKLILIGLCLIQITTASLAYSRSNAPYEVKVPTSSGDSLYAFSKQKGVLMIILDEFSSHAFYSMLTTHPYIKKELADFTYYRDVTAAFPTTYAAIPAILTGQPAPLTGSLSAYFDQASATSINEQLASKGWNSEVVTFHPICKSFKNSRCQSLNQATSLDRQAAARKELYKLLDLTFFRHAPHYLKIAIFNDEHWFLQNEGLSSLSPNHQSSIRFVDTFEKRINGDAQTPTFKLLHLLVPHGPYNLTPQCERYKGRSISANRMFANNVECALKLVKTLLERLKENGVYDSNAIIIVADHGTPIGFDNAGFGTPMHKSLRRAFPLLLVKPAHYRAPEGSLMTTDSRPLSQLELLGMISNLEKLDLQIPQSQARTESGDRLFHNYAWAHDNWSSDTLPKIKSWMVTGDSWNMDHWKPVNPQE